MNAGDREVRGVIAPLVLISDDVVDLVTES
jgi:hypothetical protein